MKFYFFRFIKTGYYGDLYQYHTNTISLIDITISHQFAFYLRNHYWLLSSKTSLEAKSLTKIDHKTTEETKDEPIYNNYWKIELGNTISKRSHTIHSNLVSGFFRVLSLLGADRPSSKSEPSRHLHQNINHVFTWSVICSASKSDRTRKKLEAFYMALMRPNLNE